VAGGGEVWLVGAGDVAVEDREVVTVSLRFLLEAGDQVVCDAFSWVAVAIGRGGEAAVGEAGVVDGGWGEVTAASPLDEEAERAGDRCASWSGDELVDTFDGGTDLWVGVVAQGVVDPGTVGHRFEVVAVDELVERGEDAVEVTVAEDDAWFCAVRADAVAVSRVNR
jgi:hypothetical protein